MYQRPMLPSTTPRVYLSRRNLQALLSELDRNTVGDGPKSMCTIIKYRSDSPLYQQTMPELAVIAVEDDVFYGSLGRAAGEMHPADEIRLSKPSSGTQVSDSLDSSQL